jgi:putative ABC transport system permease protein
MAISSFYRFGPDPERALGLSFVVPNLGNVTVVGIGFSVTRSGDVWMQPDSVRKIGKVGYEMVYRFDPGSVKTTEQMTSRTEAVTRSLPADSVTAASSYLTIRERAGEAARTISTFLTVFAALSLMVAILVISNVVSGAVIAGFRSIGVLKAVGFSPGQVTGVYFAMMIGPAVLGSAAGAVLGHFGASWMLSQFSNDYVLGLETAPAPWLHAVTIGAMLILVALTVLAPALRAGRQSATAALSERVALTGRGRTVQKRLSRSSLPRSVSLGLALPVVRPARTLLTLVAVVLGSVTVVFATGLLTSAQRWNEALTRTAYVPVQVVNPPPGAGPMRVMGSDKRQEQGTVMTDAQVEAFLRGLPGTKYVTVAQMMEASVVGTNENISIKGHRGDSSHLGYRILSGRWFSGAGEAVMGADVLHLTGKKVGDTLTLYTDDKSITVKIVGEVFGDEQEVFVDQAMVPAPELGEDPLYQYLVGLVPGVTADEYIDRVANGGNAGLIAGKTDDDNLDLLSLRIVIGTLTALLVVVAALGVAHTVVLNTRERRRHLAITKAVGMTPGQVVIMAVTSMAALGLVGGALGLPGGVVAQRYIIQLIGESEGTALPREIIDVYSAAGLSVLFLCGVVIAVLGALLPARRAARVSTAEALHTE